MEMCVSKERGGRGRFTKGIQLYLKVNRHAITLVTNIPDIWVSIFELHEPDFKTVWILQQWQFTESHSWEVSIPDSYSIAAGIDSWLGHQVNPGSRTVSKWSLIRSYVMYISYIAKHKLKALPKRLHNLLLYKISFHGINKICQMEKSCSNTHSISRRNLIQH